MRATKIIIRCLRGCPTAQRDKFYAHSRACVEHQVRKLKLRLRTQELRTGEARDALGRAADRLRAAESRVAGNEKNRARTLEEIRSAQARTRVEILLSGEMFKMLEYSADVAMGRRA